MIFDRVDNLEKYGINFLKPVIDYIKKTDWSNEPCNTFEIDGKSLTVSVVDRVLEKTATTWEVHKKFIDVHFIISGNERICFAKEADLEKTQNYNDEKDCALYAGNPKNVISYELSAGDVMVLLPGEIHLTNGHCNDAPARKAIFKVLF